MERVRGEEMENKRECMLNRIFDINTFELFFMTCMSITFPAVFTEPARFTIPATFPSRCITLDITTVATLCCTVSAIETVITACK